MIKIQTNDMDNFYFKESLVSDISRQKRTVFIGTELNRMEKSLVFVEKYDNEKEAENRVKELLILVEGK